MPSIPGFENQFGLTRSKLRGERAPEIPTYMRLAPGCGDW